MTIAFVRRNQDTLSPTGASRLHEGPPEGTSRRAADRQAELKLKPRSRCRVRRPRSRAAGCTSRHRGASSCWVRASPPKRVDTRPCMRLRRSASTCGCTRGYRSRSARGVHASAPKRVDVRGAWAPTEVGFRATRIAAEAAKRACTAPDSNERHRSLTILCYRSSPGGRRTPRHRHNGICRRAGGKFERCKAANLVQR